MYDENTNVNNDYSRASKSEMPVVRIIVAVLCYIVLLSVLSPIDLVCGIIYGIKHRNTSVKKPNWVNDSSTNAGWFIGSCLWSSIIGIIMFPYWVSKFICGLFMD